MNALVRGRATPLWIGLYALGLLCVFSFVLFEVLDVDGSDFDLTPSKVAIKLGETPHEALRRGVLGHGVVALASPLLTEVAVLPADVTARARHGHRPRPIRSVAAARAALARSLLSDVPPSA
jgi:hypothetical protein